jgi:hypothetical protein
MVWPIICAGPQLHAMSMLGSEKRQVNEGAGNAIILRYLPDSAFVAIDRQPAVK